MADMGANFNTDLLMYYLAGMGGALGGKGSWQASLGSDTQQFMATKSARDALGKVLEGLPAGSSLAMDDKGLTFKTPKESLTKQGSQERNLQDIGLLGQIAPKGEGGSGANWNLNNIPGATLDSFMRAGLLGNPNPSPLGISDANLVGLTPEFLNQALRTKLAAEEIRGRDRATELGYMSDMAKIAKENALDQPMPFNIPGVSMTLREFQSLPDEEKKYLSYLHYQYQQTNQLAEPPMNREQFRKEVNPNTRTEYLRNLISDPELFEKEKELRRSGATNINIGEKTEQEQMKKRVATEEYFASPQFGEDVEKMLGDPILNSMIQGDPNPNRRKAIETIKIIESKIASSGGKIVAPPRREGSDIVWTVKFKSGRVDEVRYGF